MILGLDLLMGAVAQGGFGRTLRGTIDPCGKAFRYGDAMKVEIPAMAFLRGFKMDHEPIMRFKDDGRPAWLVIAEFERCLARPWTPRRAIDLALDTSANVKR